MPLNANDWYILNVKWPNGQATEAELAQVFGVNVNDITFLAQPYDPPGAGTGDHTFFGPCVVRTLRCPDNGILISPPTP
ncbi:MAG TPA: hypothetical protein PK581_09365 [Caldisericia bacterium]|mgnify:CR=1 FL=1|jgi:hypothetical protein|nr:hypothetical protein [Caldisericia bacterium]